MRPRLRRLTLSVIGVCAVAVGAPVAALAALSASVADLDLGQVAYSHASQVQAGTLTLTATDTGTGGLGLANDGWNVTLLSSALAYSGPHGGTPIPAANLSITAANPPTVVSGQAISPVGGPRTTNVTGALDVTRKTLQADGPTLAPLTYYGIGTYAQAIDVSLLVPGGSRAGTYTATLTVTIAAGP
jgi:hypothetical protein